MAIAAGARIQAADLAKVTDYPARIVSGSTVGTTTSGGDLTVATGLTTITGFVAWNGDATARANMVIGKLSTSGGSVTVRCWLGNTGAVINALAARVDWIAFGT